MRQLLNQNWFFKYGEHPGMELESHPKGFSPIGLPHTFQLPYYGESSFYVGYGVYTKQLALPEDCGEHDVLLEFLGVFQEMELYVNGQAAGGHKGGYTSFVCDITPFVRPGANQLFIRVNNLWQATLPPRAGEHTFCGGIYRDVSLLILPRKRIQWNGIFVKTPEICQKTAVVRVETQTVRAQGLPLTSTVLAPDGTSAARVTSTVSGDTTVQELTVSAPLLWHPDHPYLYTLVSELYGHEQVTRFGIRSLSFSADGGFFLNGEHYLLEGVNVHQDHGGWGDAVPRSGITRDLALIKEAGFNFVRGSHYPKHPFFAEECDRLGLLFWSEAPFWGIGGFGDEGFWNASAMPVHEEDAAAFEENCMAALEEMIRAGRNHPSIFTWSMGNEIFFSRQEVMPKARALVERMTKYANILDDTRPASVGGTQRGDFHTIGDLTGFNGDGAVLFQKPELPNLVAEYGSVIAERPGAYRTCYSDGAKEQYSWRCGRALWCAFHHGSIAGIGNMGIIDLYRVPLRAYYCYREQLTGTPPPAFAKPGTPHRLSLTCDRETITIDGTQDSRLTATLLDKNNRPVSAAAEVTLTVTQGPGLFPTGNVWRMSPENGTFLDGCGAMELRAYHPGDITVEASAPGLVTAVCHITAEGAGNGSVPEVSYPACPPATSLIVAQDTDVLLSRPVQVSSEQDPHLRHMANDNDPVTFWQPSPGDKAPVWRVDMEHIYRPRALVLNIQGRRCRLEVSVSMDGEHWEPLYRNKLPRHFRGKRLGKLSGRGRYLRVAVNTPEIQVHKIAAFV